MVCRDHIQRTCPGIIKFYLIFFLQDFPHLLILEKPGLFSAQIPPKNGCLAALAVKIITPSGKDHQDQNQYSCNLRSHKGPSIFIIFSSIWISTSISISSFLIILWNCCSNALFIIHIAFLVFSFRFMASGVPRPEF